eukprot:jgi/Mesvir1/9574/Mv16830-RA.1
MGFISDIITIVLGVVAGLSAFLWFRLLELPPFRWLDGLLYGVRASDDATPREELLATRWKHDYLKTDGVRLHYAHNGKPELPLMLFLHGFPEFWYSWRHQMDAFDRDYHVVALDMRGYNTSSKPPRRADYTSPCLVADVKGVIDSLSGGRKCVLVAHDWGGAVAWQAAHAHPDLLSHLIILNSPYPRLFGKALFGGSAAQVRRSWYIFAFQLPGVERLLAGGKGKKAAAHAGASTSSAAGSNTTSSKAGEMITSTMRRRQLSPQDQAAFNEAAGGPGTLRAMVNYYRNIFSARQAAPKGGAAQRGPALMVPTLVIWGQEDKYLGMELNHGLDRYVQDVTVKYIPGASHWVNQDTPEEVNAAMAAFLGGSSQ